MRASCLESFRSSGKLDVRGTYLTADLVDNVVAACRDAQATTEQPLALDLTNATVEGCADFSGLRLGEQTHFDRTTFLGRAEFRDSVLSASFVGTEFGDEAGFDGARFTMGRFNKVSFGGAASFARTAWEGPFVFLIDSVFMESADFGHAAFGGQAVLQRNAFHRDARFSNVSFHGQANFTDTSFAGPADFSSSTFGAATQFANTRFHAESSFTSCEFGPQASFANACFAGDAAFSGSSWGERSVFAEVAGRGFDFSAARLGSGISFSVAARRVRLDRLSPPGDTTTLTIATADVRMEDANISSPLLISGPGPGSRDSMSGATRYGDLETTNMRPRITSLRFSNVESLVLSSVDLSGCLFSDARNLDRIKIEGASTFARVPDDVVVGGHACRWARRLMIAEERIWRSEQGHFATLGWTRRLERTNPRAATDARPLQLASLYRSLRQALEDTKNEPGATDFYYGEMEMRRLGSATLSVQRWILSLYWATAGYSLRAWRAAASLAVLLLTSAAVLVSVGFTDSGERGFWSAAVFGARSGFALESSARGLTAAGSVTQIVLRLACPALLALFVLALRARVKR